MWRWRHNILCQRRPQQAANSARREEATYRANRQDNQRDGYIHTYVQRGSVHLQFILHLKFMNPLILWCLICLQMYTFCRVIDSHTVTIITWRLSCSFLLTHRPSGFFVLSIVALTISASSICSPIRFVFSNSSSISFSHTHTHSLALSAYLYRLHVVLPIFFLDFIDDDC